MASSKSLRLRQELTHKFEQLSAALDEIARRSAPAGRIAQGQNARTLLAGPAHDDSADEAVLAEARRVLVGVSMQAHPPTMAIFFRALNKVLEEMQPEIDAAGWLWTHERDHKGEKY